MNTLESFIRTAFALKLARFSFLLVYGLVSVLLPFSLRLRVAPSLLRCTSTYRILDIPANHYNVIDNHDANAFSTSFPQSCISYTLVLVV